MRNVVFQMFLAVVFMSPGVCSDDHHIVFVMWTYPKKVPFLEYTIDYFLNSYNYNHDGIVVDAVFITLGCQDCNFPVFTKAVNKLIRNNITVYNVTTDHPAYGDETFLTATKDKFESWFVDIKKDTTNRRQFHRFSNYQKDNLVNTHAIALAKYAAQTVNSDFLIFFEDDIAIEKRFFEKTKKILDSYQDGQQVLTRVLLNIKRYETVEVQSPKDKVCVAGFFGMILGKKEFKRWTKFAKYNNVAVCGDAFHCYMKTFLDLPLKLSQFGRHIGRDKNPKEREHEYWD